MTIFHKTIIECDGCRKRVECDSHHIPPVILDLKERGWVFNYSVWCKDYSTLHLDYCNECVALELPEQVRLKLIKGTEQ